MKKLFFSIIAAAICLQMSAQELNVASFNIRNNTPADYEHNDGWNQRVDILCDMIRFSAFDAFGAQEVKHQQLLDMLERLPEYAYMGVGRDDGATAGEYSPVFYNKEKFKCLGGGTFWLSETPDEISRGWDARLNRICSYAHLKDIKTKQEFWFFNCHLDHIGVIARRESVKVIIDKVNEIAGPKANVIITGDFNVNQFSEPAATILSTGRVIDSFAAAEKKFAPSGTFNSWSIDNYTSSRIDHIFVSSDAKVSRYGVLTYHYWFDQKKGNSKFVDAPKEIESEKREAHTLSDHYPINAFVSFPRKK